MDEEAIFLEALQQTSPAARVAFLDEVCAGNPSLREGVELLLKAHEKAGAFLQGKPPGLSPTIDQPIREKPGMQIGPYKLLQQIGEGGFGVVYMAAQDQPVKRRLALKIIKPGMDTRQVIARFEAERQALAMMDHPNIAKVLDAGATESGRPYFVMELVNGISITKYCDEQHLTPKERLELFVPICQAVQHAHQKGIIHRDLKPSNVLVAEYDHKAVPKVIDFGVAKATSQTLTEKTMFTQLGQVVGTLEYMSPEQAKRNQLDVDTRSDIYSLGVLLYELLTGETPFDRERLRSAAYDEMLRIIREEEPPRPSLRLSSSQSLPSIAACRKIEPKKLSTLVRGELDWIVMKSLEKDRKRRYASAAELAADIERHLNDEPVAAGPPSRIYQLRKFARRHRTEIVAISAFILLLCAGIVASSWQAVRATQAERQTKSERDRARQAEQRAAAERDDAQLARQREARARRDAELARQAEVAAHRVADELAEQRRQRLFATEIQLAQQAYENANVDHALELLLHHVPRNGELDLRGFEWYYLWRLCHAERQTLRLVDEARAVAFSPDNRLLVTSGAGADAIALWDVATGQLQATIAGVGHHVQTLAFSPDGQMIAAGGWDGSAPARSTASAALVDLKSRQVVFRFAGLDQDLQPAASAAPDSVAAPGPSPRAVVAVAFAADGRTLALAATQYYEDGGVPRTRHGYVASTRPQREIGLWDVSTGRLRASPQAKTGGVLSLAFSPDGQWLAAGCWDRSVRLWNPADGRLVKTLDRHRAYVWAVTFSPDGRRLASGAGKWDGPPEILIWEVPEFQVQKQLHGHSTGVTALAFSGDGQLLASGGWDRRVKLWNVEDGVELRCLVGHRSHVKSLAFSPDGQLLASGSSDRTARLWYVHDALDHAVFRGPRAGCYGLSFAPDDQRLAISSPNARVIDLTSGATVAEYPVAGGDALVAWSPDGRLLATASSSPVITLRDAVSGEVLHEWKAHQRKIWSLEFSPDGQLLASGSQDNTVGLWDVLTAREVRRWEGSGYTIRALAFSPDGSRLAGCCHRPPVASSSDLRVWQVETGKLECVLRAGKDGFHHHMAEDVAFTPDGCLLATSSHDGTARLWDTQSWQLQRILKGHQDVIYGLSIAPDGRTLATASWDGTVKLWNIGTGLLLLTLRGQQGVVYSVAFSHDNRMLAAGSAHMAAGAPSVRQTRLLFAAGDDEVQATLAAAGHYEAALKATIQGDCSVLRSVHWTRDGQRIACGDRTGRVAVYDRRTGEKVIDVQAHAKVSRAKFFDDDQALVTVGMDGTATIRDAMTGAVAVKLEGHEGGIRAVAVSPDGRTIATGGDERMVILWDVPKGELRTRITGQLGVISDLAFSPDSQWVAGCSWDGRVYLWNAISGAQRSVFEGATAALVSVAFSPDGRLLAAGGGYHDPTIRVWDVESKRQIAALRGHCGDVQGLAFGQQGRRLWSTAWDSSLRFWDTATWEEGGVWYVSDRPVYTFARSPDGGEIATGGEDEACRIWDVATLSRIARPRPRPAKPPIPNHGAITSAASAQPETGGLKELFNNLFTP